MEYHKVLKEIHFSYFRNIIKSRSEYFEHGIIHFPRDQPRTTLGFACKPTAAWGKRHRTAIPASSFPRDTSGSPACLPRCPQPFSPLSACLKNSSRQLLPRPPHGRAPIPPAHAGVTPLSSEPGTFPWPKEAPKLSGDEYIGGQTHNTQEARQEYFSSLQVGLTAKEGVGGQ